MSIVPEKTDRLVISYPLNFIVPRYRLSVVDAGVLIVAEQSLELNHAPPTEPLATSMFLLFQRGEVSREHI